LHVQTNGKSCQMTVKKSAVCFVMTSIRTCLVVWLLQVHYISFLIDAVHVCPMYSFQQRVERRCADGRIVLWG
jgi:hypothetical protein